MVIHIIAPRESCLVICVTTHHAQRAPQIVPDVPLQCHFAAIRVLLQAFQFTFTDPSMPTSHHLLSHLVRPPLSPTPLPYPQEALLLFFTPQHAHSPELVILPCLIPLCPTSTPLYTTPGGRRHKGGAHSGEGGASTGATGRDQGDKLLGWSWVLELGVIKVMD